MSVVRELKTRRSRQRVRDVMTPSVEVATPAESIRSASERMRRMNIGALPVCENDRLVGLVTDRDLVVRGLAQGLDPDESTVREVMTEGIFFIFEDQSLREAAVLMQEIQIRRLPVLNSKKRMVGIISMKDIASTSRADALSGKALRRICQDSA